MEIIKRYYNKIRILFLTYFTDRVKHITIKDEESGKEIKATIEKKKEKVCDHSEIKQIKHILWKCNKCDDIYFMIPNKIVVMRPEMVDFAEAIADNLGAKLNDKE